MSKKKKGLRGIHENTIDWLVKRLEESGKFDVVEKDVCYNKRDLNGQVDVMAYIHDKTSGIKRFYFYEVKSSAHPRAIKRAQKQYDRYRKAHPKQYVEGYFVSRDLIQRLEE